MTTSEERLSSLLEREAEISRLAGAIGGAADGRGGLVLVEGVAGVGKSTILAHAREQAGAGGCLILSARGDELERAFPFGLATQLLAEPTRRSPRAILRPASRSCTACTGWSPAWPSAAHC